MKVSYCLAGAAMVLMTGEADAWSFPVINAIINAFKKPTPAPAPTPAPTPKATPAPTPAPTPKATPAPTIKTKTILMRGNIVPEWTDVAPVGATQISLMRVNDYWTGLKNSDLKTYEALCTSTAEILTTKTKIEAYYDEALKCLSESSLSTKFAPDVFKVKMDSVSTCLGKSTVPSFVVLETNMITPLLSTYAPKLEADEFTAPAVKETDPPATWLEPVKKSDESITPGILTLDAATTGWSKEEEKPSPVTYLEPLNNVVEPSKSSDEYIAPGTGGADTNLPAEIAYVETHQLEPRQDEPLEPFRPIDLPVAPGTNGAGIPPLDILFPSEQLKQPEPVVEQEWDHTSLAYGPTTPTVPIFWALDTNKDALMTPAEWLEYIHKLNQLALVSANKAKDKQSQAMLRTIIDFHYDNLEHCIFSLLGQSSAGVMTASQFQAFASSVEHSCNVKFRYSLLAGTPPFEWIAGKKTAVSTQDITNWFNNRLSLAVQDAEKKSAKSEALQTLPARKEFVGCVQNSLEPHRGELIERSTFYKVVGNCAQ